MQEYCVLILTSNETLFSIIIIFFSFNFRYILDKRSNLQGPFLKLTQYCTSVLCCRTTPLQKAYIVKIVKEQLKMRTLAIGKDMKIFIRVVLFLVKYIELCLGIREVV